MMAVTSEDFHTAWNGMKAKANTLDLKGWMRDDRRAQRAYPRLAIVLRGLSGRARPDDGEADAWAARGYGQSGACARNLLERSAVRFRDQCARSAQRCRACSAAQGLADRRAADRGPLSRGSRARCGGGDREAGRNAGAPIMGTDGLAAAFERQSAPDARTRGLISHAKAAPIKLSIRSDPGREAAASALHHRDVDAPDLALGADLDGLLVAVGRSVRLAANPAASTNTSIWPPPAVPCRLPKILRLASLQLPEIRSPWLVTSLLRSNL